MVSRASNRTSGDQKGSYAGQFGASSRDYDRRDDDAEAVDQWLKDLLDQPHRAGRDRVEDTARPVNSIFDSLSRISRRIDKLQAGAPASHPHEPRSEVADPAASRGDRPSRRDRLPERNPRRTEREAGNPRGFDPEPGVKAVRGELARMRSAIEHRAEEDHTVLRGEVAALREQIDSQRGIGNRYFDRSQDNVVRRLDTIRGLLEKPLDTSGLNEQLGEIRRLLALAPSERELSGFTSRLSHLADHLDRLDMLEDQLYKVERIANNFDTLPELGRHMATLGEIARQLDDLPRMTAEMDRRLDMLPRMADDMSSLRRTVSDGRRDESRALDEMMARLDEIARRLDSPNGARSTRELAAIELRLGDVADRIERFGGTSDPRALSLLESRIADLAHDLTGRLKDFGIGTTEAVTTQLTDMERRMSRRTQADAEFLEDQIAGLAERIDLAMGGDLADQISDSINRLEAVVEGNANPERLIEIETRLSQLANSLESVKSISQQEAARIVHDIAALRGIADGLLAPALQGMESELRALDRKVEELARGNPDPQVLSRIEQRLEALASRVEVRPMSQGWIDEAFARIEARFDGQMLHAHNEVAVLAREVARETMDAIERKAMPNYSEAFETLQGGLASLQEDLAHVSRRDQASLEKITELLHRLSTAGTGHAPSPAHAQPSMQRTSVTAESGHQRPHLRVNALLDRSPSEDMQEERSQAHTAERWMVEPHARPETIPQPPKVSAAPATQAQAIARARAQRNATSAQVQSSIPSVALGEDPLDLPLTPLAAPAARQGENSPAHAGHPQTRREPAGLSSAASQMPAASQRPVAAQGTQLRTPQLRAPLPPKSSAAQMAAERADPQANFIAAARRAALGSQLETGLYGGSHSPSVDQEEAVPLQAYPRHLAGLRRSLLMGTIVVIVLVGLASLTIPLVLGRHGLNLGSVTPQPASTSMPDRAGKSDMSGLGTAAPNANRAVMAPVDPVLDAQDQPGSDAADKPVPATASSQQFAPIVNSAPAQSPFSVDGAPSAQDRSNASDPQSSNTKTDRETAAPIPLTDPLLGAMPAMQGGPTIKIQPPKGAGAVASSLTAPATVVKTDSIPLLADTIGTPEVRKAAISGDPRAMFIVGNLLADSRMGTPSPDKSLYWIRRAAEQNFAPAQFNLGLLYEKGQQVPKDLNQAFKWQSQAAASGNVSAMHSLAVLYVNGVNGKTDYTKAAEWFEKAANFGVRDSQYNLGQLYSRGWGVELDLANAYKWFDIAARSGDQEAATKRDQTASVLDRASLARGRLAADTWKVKIPDPAANSVNPNPAWGLTGELPTGSTSSTAPVKASNPLQYVQARLSVLGYDIGKADGMMGDKTHAAIIAFQRSQGLAATGLVDDALINALNPRR